jgi:hypothetical protein
MRKGQDVREFFRSVQVDKLMNWMGVADSASDPISEEKKP